MRLGALIVSVLLLFASLTAQQKYVVSSKGDVILLPKGKSALGTIQEQMKKKAKVENAKATCSPLVTFGNNPAFLTEDSRFLHGHKDLAGWWFETPTTGTLDSVYIRTGNESAAQFPHNLTMRIHHSNLNTGHAPGWGDWIAPPRLCWGFFRNTLDADTFGHIGVAAFPGDATSPIWVSSYQEANGDSLYHYGFKVDTSKRSFAPAGDELWIDGGAEIPIHNAAITALDLSPYGKPTLTKGEPWFISFAVPGDHPTGYVDINTDPTRMTFAAAGDGVGTPAGYSDGVKDLDVRRSFHNFKFYEHPLYCGKPGWIARGDDNLFFWYVMTAAGDVPPTFSDVAALGHTLQTTGSRLVTAQIEDCNFITSGTGSGVGVDTAQLIYSIDGAANVTVTMDNLGGGAYQASIPANACPNSVTYHLRAVDVNGNAAQSVSTTYRTLCPHTAIAVVDTTAPRSYTGALYADGGTSIDTTKWFAPTLKSSNHAKFDDGTAGPYSIGSFSFLGDTMHYAWVGTNGDIALSKTATDTVNVTYNGYGNRIEFPYRLTQAGALGYSGADTSTANGLPRNFICPMQADLMVFDTASGGTAYGHVYYHNTDSNFVVEWDSVANFNSAGAAIADEEIFRVVLNKKDGSIEYQYDNIGVNGLDSAALVGAQADSQNTNEIHGFIELNYSADPYQFKPRNNWQMKLWLAQKVAVGDGWNMLSVAPIPAFSNYAKTALFVDAASAAFKYEAGYKSQATLTNGVGYWLKYVGAQNIGVAASTSPHTTQDAALLTGWNMTGSVTTPVSAALTTTPTDQLASQFFGYNINNILGYSNASVIIPGQGYWVKAKSNCTLHIAPSTAKEPVSDDLSKLNAITLRGGNGSQKLYLGDESLVKAAGMYELPPTAPSGFDARFSSQQMVETYPSTIQTGKVYQYNINLQSASYPVLVQWNVSKQPEGRTLVLTDGINGTIINSPMTGTGSVRITNASVKMLVVKLVEGVVSVPKAFALSQNYPNPFNPTTRVSVEMPKSAEVEVAVYDILGQKIATLLSGQQGAGYHTVEWNGTNQAGLNVPSGTYFIRMISENYTKVQKVMLMK